jgi:hypothetical protein
MFGPFPPTPGMPPKRVFVTVLVTFFSIGCRSRADSDEAAISFADSGDSHRHELRRVRFHVQPALVKQFPPVEDLVGFDPMAASQPDRQVLRAATFDVENDSVACLGFTPMPLDSLILRDRFNLSSNAIKGFIDGNPIAFFPLG